MKKQVTEDCKDMDVTIEGLVKAMEFYSAPHFVAEVSGVVVAKIFPGDVWYLCPQRRS